jgi:hypothetical protein
MTLTRFSRSLSTAAIAAATLSLLVLAPSPATAQTFPDDGWVAFRCGGVLAFDPLRDEPGAIGERDAVGDAAAPAVFLAADTEFIYFRMRVDADPTSGTMWRPFGWAIVMDILGTRDGDNYDVSVVVDGTASEVRLYRNTAGDGSVGDPPDLPPVATYPAATHARALAADSSIGGNPDYFVDWAAPITDLESVGVTADAFVASAFGTSSSPPAIDADVVCFDNGTGEAVFREVATDPVERDGRTPPDSDGDGFDDATEIRAGTDPNDANDFPAGAPSGLHIRGGPAACAASGGPTSVGGAPVGGAPAGLALVGWGAPLLFVGILVARRRRTRARV